METIDSSDMDAKLADNWVAFWSHVRADYTKYLWVKVGATTFRVFKRPFGHRSWRDDVTVYEGGDMARAFMAYNAL